VWREGRCLVLSLDTPGASVNVFGPPAAAALDAVLSALPPAVDTLLLCSGKPGSFVNGAGLLYAQAMESAAGALRLSGPVCAVYDRLEAAPVRKVALLEGNCFGCGLELALCCDVLLAREAGEVQLRMPELVDYRFVPLFGGTWRLPRRVGPAAAARLLLDGEVWDARTALRHGLVDALLPALPGPDGTAGPVDVAGVCALAARAAAARAGGRRRGASRVPARALRVPPARAPLWARTAALLEASGGLGPAEARARELEAFADTVVSRSAKRAMSFFFVRHAARAASLGDAQRRPPRVRLTPRAGHTGGPAALLRLPSLLGPLPELAVRAAGRQSLAGEGFCVHWPWGTGRPACEVAATQGGLAAGREAARALEWLGQEVVLTRAGAGGARPAGTVSARLLRATRAELARLQREGHAAARINRALWEEGHARPFRWADWPQARAGRVSAEASAEVLGRLHALWAGLLREAVREGALWHETQGDVLLHLLFDAPLEAEPLLRRTARGGGASAPAQGG
jgi:enoyl-CoA hydratase/carnithine racemase